MSIVPSPRKAAYKAFFQVSQNNEIQGVYQWHQDQDLSAEAFLILCDFEVISEAKFMKQSLNCIVHKVQMTGF